MTLCNQVTIKQYRDDDFCTHIKAYLAPPVRPDAAAAKNDSEKDHGVDFAYDPVFIDDLKGGFMDACEIGQANQAAGSLHNQDNVISVASAVSLRQAPSSPSSKAH